MNNLAAALVPVNPPVPDREPFNLVLPGGRVIGEIKPWRYGEWWASLRLDQAFHGHEPCHYTSSLLQGCGNTPIEAIHDAFRSSREKAVATLTDIDRLRELLFPSTPGESDDDPA